MELLESCTRGKRGRFILPSLVVLIPFIFSSDAKKIYLFKFSKIILSDAIKDIIKREIFIIFGYSAVVRLCQKFTWHFVDITAFLTPRRPACSLNSRVFSERLKWFKATNITSDILITISYHSYYYFKDTFVTFCLRHVSLFLLFYLTLVNSFIGYRMNGKWKTRIRVSGLQSVKYQITTVSPLQEKQKT